LIEEYELNDVITLFIEDEKICSLIQTYTLTLSQLGSILIFLLSPMACP